MKIIIKNPTIHIVANPAIAAQLEQIMTTQTEIAARLDAVTANLANISIEVSKVGTETQTLLDKVADLTALLENAGAVTPELQSAVDAVEAQAGIVKTGLDVVDGLVADAPTP